MPEDERFQPSPAVAQLTQLAKKDFPDFGLEYLAPSEVVDYSQTARTNFQNWLEGYSEEEQIAGLEREVTDNILQFSPCFNDIQVYDIKLKEEDESSSAERHIVLLDDGIGNKTIVAVCMDKRRSKPEEEKDPAYGSLAVIGGCGLYDTPKWYYPAYAALEHTKFLSAVMARKCCMAGLDLGGMKATIPGETPWKNSPVLQALTGWLFSKNGPFKKAITGTDARQTPLTITHMAKGSEIGGDHQIAGMIEVLDTPASCRHSLKQTHFELQKTFGEAIPSWQKAVVLVEGFGRIGRTAVRLALDEMAKEVIVADPLLTGEDHLLPKELRDNPERLSQAKAFAREKLERLLAQYGKRRIRIVKTTELEHEKGQIFIPCSTSEGNLTQEKLKHLQEADVKLILTGANGPFDKTNVWQLAKFAADLGIIMPPEILTNCGSVTAAAMEPIFRARLEERGIGLSDKERVRREAEVFVDTVVIPHIEINTREKLASLVSIMQEDNVDLYTAGEIFFRKVFGIPYLVEDGLLIE